MTCLQDNMLLYFKATAFLCRGGIVSTKSPVLNNHLNKCPAGSRTTLARYQPAVTPGAEKASATGSTAIASAQHAATIDARHDHLHLPLLLLYLTLFHRDTLA